MVLRPAIPCAMSATDIRHESGRQAAGVSQGGGFFFFFLCATGCRQVNINVVAVKVARARNTLECPRPTTGITMIPHGSRDRKKGCYKVECADRSSNHFVIE